MDNLLQELCSIPGVSGCEEVVCKYVFGKLKDFADTKITNDNTVIANIGNDSAKKHIMFDSHIDQIGLIVTHIGKDGFINFDTCGGLDPRILYGAIVTVHGDKDFKGVIGSIPPHLNKYKEKMLSIDDMFIDLGLSFEETNGKIRPGDRVSFSNRFYKLLNDNIVSPATDDRSGVYVLIKLAEKLSSENLDCKFTILLSSREEVGQMGARTAAYKIMPNESISVDVSFAKQPGVSHGRHCILGDGPMIGIAPSLNKKISKTLKYVAETINIPYQTEVMSGKSGTNADVISIAKGGIPGGLVSIPQRYMHTGIEMINKNDLDNTVELLFNYAKQGGTNL